MFVLKKGLFIAITILCIYFYNGCFAGDEVSEITEEDIKDKTEVSSDSYRSAEEQKGPNQNLKATAYYTSDKNGRVKLRKLLDNDPTPKSVYGFMSHLVYTYATQIALSYKSEGQWVHVDYRAYENYVKSVARAFINLGLESRNGVGILGSNSPEWFYSNLGAIYAGGISLGLNVTIGSEACFHWLGKTHANIVVVEDEEQVKDILKMKPNLPFLKKIIQYKGTPPAVEDVLSWDYVIQLGQKETDDKLNSRLKSMGFNECCTIVLTSGTTGAPKAVMLSHDNLTYSAGLIKKYLGMKHVKKIVSYLPLSHIAAQITDIYSAIAIGGHVYFADKDALNNVDSLVETVRDVQPTFFMGTPRIWEQLKDIVVEMENNAGFSTKILSRSAKTYGVQHCGQEKKRTSCFLISRQVVYDYILYDSAKTILGLNKTELFITAVAPIPPELKKYFRSVGIPLIEAYGMSECSGASTISSPTDIKSGVGTAFKGVETKINTPKNKVDGELLLNGRHVFMGYLGLPEETKNSFDINNLFFTGDLARMDHRGFLTITRRKKEMLITEGGEKVVLEYIVNYFKTRLPVISYAFLIGEKRPFLSILLSLKCETEKDGKSTDYLTMEVRNWMPLRKNSCSTMSEVIDKKPKEVFDAIQTVIDHLNANTISSELKIQKFAFVSDFSYRTGELNIYDNINRPAILEKYKGLIESFYLK